MDDWLESFWGMMTCGLIVLGILYVITTLLAFRRWEEEDEYSGDAIDPKD